MPRAIARSRVPTDHQVLSFLHEGGDNWSYRVADHFFIAPRTAQRILRRLVSEEMLREDEAEEPGYLPRYYVTQTGSFYLIPITKTTGCRIRS